MLVLEMMSWEQLQILADHVANEIANREREDNIETYACGHRDFGQDGCKFRHTDELEVVKHLKKAHRYPLEDACSTVTRIYR